MSKAKLLIASAGWRVDAVAAPPHEQSESNYNTVTTHTFPRAPMNADSRAATATGAGSSPQRMSWKRESAARDKICVTPPDARAVSPPGSAN